MSRRLSDEMRLVQRMLELVEAKWTGRVNTLPIARSNRTRKPSNTLADVIEAEDRCDALQDVDSDMARRITRRALDGTGSPCDSQRPSIRRQTN